MGKPKEKRFKVGADLVITPIDRLTISKRTDTGNMMIVAAKNIDPAAPIPVLSNIYCFLFQIHIINTSFV